MSLVHLPLNLTARTYDPISASHMYYVYDCPPPPPRSPSSIWLCPLRHCQGSHPCALQQKFDNLQLTRTLATFCSCTDQTCLSLAAAEFSYLDLLAPFTASTSHTAQSEHVCMQAQRAAAEKKAVFPRSVGIPVSLPNLAQDVLDAEHPLHG